MFAVVYVDDFGKKHYTVVPSAIELKFIKDRFEKVQVL